MRVCWLISYIILCNREKERGRRSEGGKGGGRRKNGGGKRGGTGWKRIGEGGIGETRRERREGEGRENDYKF